jgi:hypothetical protein
MMSSRKELIGYERSGNRRRRRGERTRMLRKGWRKAQKSLVKMDENRKNSNRVHVSGSVSIPQMKSETMPPVSMPQISGGGV